MEAFTARARTRRPEAARCCNPMSRACLDATRDADELLREALGPKKLKELRRQRNRLAEHGEVTFDVARTPAEVARALETFLILEASGWKARRGTALVQDDGDAAFIRRAAARLGARGHCEIVTLHAGDTPVAAGDRAAASGPRVLFQARRRRALREILARRAADARTDAASLRGSCDRHGRFHAQPRPSDDRSDLARHGSRSATC